MSASLAILTIGIVPMQEVLPLLTEYIDEDNISHHSLLGKLVVKRWRSTRQKQAKTPFYIIK